jgi:hypothetical protein
MSANDEGLAGLLTSGAAQVSKPLKNGPLTMQVPLRRYVTVGVKTSDWRYCPDSRRACQSFSMSLEELAIL